MFRTPDSCSEPGTASTSKIRPADLGLVDQANRTRARGFKLGFPNCPVPVPVHFLDSKALSSLGLFYLVYMLSREPTHKFHPPILGNERPLSLCGDGPKFLFWDFRLLPAGGSEDVVGFGGSGAYFAAL